MTRLPYLDAHAASDGEAWRGRVSTVLKGKSVDSLRSQTYDAIPVAPLYEAARASTPVARAASGWSAMQRIDNPDPEAARKQALEDLENGADGLHLVFAESVGAYGFGLPSDAPLGGILRDVIFDAEVPIELDCSDGTGAAAAMLADAIVARGASLANTRIAFGIDPFTRLARGGTCSDRGTLASRAKALREKGFAGSPFVADARIIHAAGGSEAQELGYALAAGVAILRLLDEAGIMQSDKTSAISFRFAVDPDEFVGVAKLRAFRQLWAAVERDCELTPSSCQVHAETGWRAMTRRDPDANMLRATLAIFAAAVGGADRISVLPHTQAIGLPDAFARRVTRNAQLVLREEANLDKVADPAAGSGGIEALTSALCEKGWDVFRNIEAVGGLESAIEQGAFRESVATVAKARAKSIARRKDGITGVSEFPLVGETPPHVEAPIAELGETKTPFAPIRLAEPFERLRDRADAELVATGYRPKVFLATLGPLAAHAARTTFAKNLFEAGGFETVTHTGGDDDASLAEAFRSSGANIACLCGSDAVYTKRAAPAAVALAPHAKCLLLAGRPGEHEAAWRQAGVDDFAFVGADVLALLESLAAH